MKKVLLLLVISISVLSGCATKSTNTDLIDITTTVDPVYDMASTIGGEYVNVTSIYPTGVDIHEYEITPQDMQSLVDSDLFFYISYTSDAFVKDLENSGEYNTKFINITETPSFKSELDPSLYSENGIIDPHVWNSPKEDMLIAGVIEDELCAYDNTNCDYYTKNYETLMNELELIDQAYTEFAKVQTKPIIVSHQAFDYLSLDYGIEIQSVYGMTHDAEPTSKEIESYVNTINEQNIGAIFCDANDMENKVMQQIVNETGVELVPIYNLEAMNDMDFKEQLNSNLEGFKQWLE